MAFKTINARAETVAATASFREPFKSQRCLIPADGFYEWQRNGKTKQPYCFEVNDGELFAFAGLWDRWRNQLPGWVVVQQPMSRTPNACADNCRFARYSTAIGGLCLFSTCTCVLPKSGQNRAALFPTIKRSLIPKFTRHGRDRD